MPRLVVIVRLLAVGFMLAAVVTVRPGLADTSGPATVIDGDTLLVGGRTIQLFGIDAPELGQECRRSDRQPTLWVRCGVIARAQLMDLTAAQEVVCRPAGADHGICQAGGYDLSEGMAYTGWAVVDEDAPARYHAVSADAKAEGRGLWIYDFVMPAAWRAGKRLATR